jgi:hypothetical protein
VGSAERGLRGNIFTGWQKMIGSNLHERMAVLIWSLILGLRIALQELGITLASARTGKTRLKK